MKTTNPPLVEAFAKDSTERAVGRLSHTFSLNSTPWQTLLQSALAGIDEADNSQLTPEPPDFTDLGSTEAAGSD